MERAGAAGREREAGTVVADRARQEDVTRSGDHEASARVGRDDAIPERDHRVGDGLAGFGVDHATLLRRRRPRQPEDGEHEEGERAVSVAWARPPHWRDPPTRASKRVKAGPRSRSVTRWRGSAKRSSASVTTRPSRATAATYPARAASAMSCAS